MKLGIEELSIIVEGLRLRVKQLSSSVTEINQSIENLETEDGSKAPAIMQTTSPAGIASFSDGGEDMPIKSLKCTIVPVQAGTGDPAPDNIRPITGWNGVTVTRTGTDPADTESYNIQFPQTVYGGWVDAVKGELHVTRGYKIYDGSQDEAWIMSTTSGYTRFNINDLTDSIPGTGRAEVICNMGSYASSGQYEGAVFKYGNNQLFYIPDQSITTLDAFKSYLSATPMQVLYELATEQVIPITPVTISTLLGNNNISCTTGTVEVEYAADTKMYIDNAIASVTPEPEPSPEPEQDEAPPEEEEEEEAEPAPEEEIAEPEPEEVEEAAEVEEIVPVVKKSTRKK